MHRPTGTSDFRGRRGCEGGGGGGAGVSSLPKKFHSLNVCVLKSGWKRTQIAVKT